MAGMILWPIHALCFGAFRLLCGTSARPFPGARAGRGTFDVLVPFGDELSLNPRDVEFWFKPALGSGLHCDSAEPHATGARVFECFNDEFKFECTVSSEALSLEVANALASTATPDFTEREQTLLRANQGFVRVRCVHGTVARLVSIGSDVVTRLLAVPGALGVMNASASSYHPIEWVRPLLASGGDPADEAVRRFLLFTSLHAVAEPGRVWLHTHGLEQFGQPDLQVRYQDPGRAEYFSNLLTNAAIYMIQSGRTLRPGDTAELAGDGIVYRIHAAPPDPGHPFGKVGAVEIAPESTA